MQKKQILLTLIIILIVCVVGYLIYTMINSNKTYKANINKYKDDIKKLENKISDLENNSKEMSETLDISFIVGKYLYKKHDSACDVEVNLTLKEDGTFIYENYDSCIGKSNAEGTYAMGSNKIYLYNKLCMPVPDSTARKCEYPNCKNIIELDYKKGKIITNNIKSGRVSAELEKIKE